MNDLTFSKAVVVFGLLGTLMLSAADQEAQMKKQFVYVAGYNNTVTCFVFDPATGALQPSSSSDAGKNPTYLAWSPSHKIMYAINEVGEGRVAAFSIKPGDGSLTKIGDASAAGNGPCHVSVHPSGKWVFAANYGSGHIGILPVKADGGVGEPEKILAGKNAHQMIADASGHFVFVPCLGSNYVAEYAFDDATGQLKPNDPPHADTIKGAGPRHIAIHSNGRFAYLINELNSTMTSFKYDSAKGILSDGETLSTLPAGVTMKNSCAHVVVSPSGKFLYGSNRGHNSIVIFSINPDTGRLTLVGHETGDGEINIPRDFTIDPSGQYLLAASQQTHVVTVFRCDAEKGTLKKLHTVNVPSGPAFVGVMTAPE